MDGEGVIAMRHLGFRNRVALLLPLVLAVAACVATLVHWQVMRRWYGDSSAFPNGQLALSNTLLLAIAYCLFLSLVDGAGWLVEHPRRRGGHLDEGRTLAWTATAVPLCLFGVVLLLLMM